MWLEGNYILERWTPSCRRKDVGGKKCNIYAAQQDTQSVLMSEFIQRLC